jgi:hypothetical protein
MFGLGGPMSGTDHQRSLPYRTISAALTCAVVAFGFAIAAGVLEVRRPVKPAPTSQPKPEAVPKSYVQRVKSAEALADQGVVWVYRFAGGLPKCWAEIDSEGHKRTIGPWVSVKEAHFFFGADPLDRPVPESVEGYVALFRPTTKEQTYRLVCAVTMAKYPDNSKRELQLTGFREPFHAKLPDLLPPAERPKEEGPGLSARSYRNDGEEQQAVVIGEEAELNFLSEETPSGKRRNIRLMFRFLTPEEVEGARR